MKKGAALGLGGRVGEKGGGGGGPPHEVMVWRRGQSAGPGTPTQTAITPTRLIDQEGEDGGCCSNPAGGGSGGRHFDGA